MKKIHFTLIVIHPKTKMLSKVVHLKKTKAKKRKMWKKKQKNCTTCKGAGWVETLVMGADSDIVPCHDCQRI